MAFNRSDSYCCRCRRTYSEIWAEWLRSLLGQQERWVIWPPLGEREAGRELCHLGASSIYRWLDQARKRTVAEQLAGMATSGVMGVDGLFVYQLPEQQGLVRVRPEWLWRDYRQRLSSGHSARDEERLDR